MSTIHCRFCGGRGHNKLSCPSVKEHYEQAKNMLANKEVEDAYHLPYTHRWAYNIMQRKENIAANAKAARAAGTSIRKCSYCGTTGHARNKCEFLASDRANLLAYEKRYRSAFAAWLPNSGIGVGAGSLEPKRRRFGTQSGRRQFFGSAVVRRLDIADANGHRPHHRHRASRLAQVGDDLAFGRGLVADPAARESARPQAFSGCALD